MILDDFQKKAVETTEKRVLVSACPGSGKSRTVCARYDYMVNKLHVPPSQIAVITFTRYAAGELRNRIGPSIGSSFLGTFHAFALKILESYGDRRKWSPEFLTILDEAETSLDEDEILHDLGIRNRNGGWSRIKAGDWEKFKRYLSAGMPTDIKPDVIDKCSPVWMAFVDRLRSQNTLTFDLIMSEATALMDDPKIIAELRGRWKYFLIDEGQDCDTRQYDLVSRFNPESIFLVGDIDQSVYAWRGARPDLFLKFADGATCYYLPNSYRFGIQIAAPANRLIRYNTERMDTAINAIASNHGTVNVVNEASYEQIAEIVKGELKEHEPKDIAILGRRHVTLDWAHSALRKAGIPCTRIGGDTSITNTAEYRAVRGYLRLSVNPQDRRAFMAIAAPEHLSTEAMWSLREKAAASGETLLKEYGKELPKELDEIHAHLQANDGHHDYAPAVEYIRDVIRDESIVDNAELVRTLAMEGMQDQLRTVKNTVALMTCHGAKGLEFPVVLIVGLNKKSFPSPRSVREGRIEEEVRLQYVAMTRAEETLYLISGEPESQEDGKSIFFEQMGLDSIASRR